MRKLLSLLALLVAGCAHAQVTTPYVPQIYNCDGVTSNPVFATSWPFINATDLSVTAKNNTTLVTSIWVYNSDYTVSGGSYAPGSITYQAGVCPSNYTVTIARAVPLTQPTAFRSQGTFNPKIHGNAFDRTEMQVQQVQALAASGVPGPTGATGATGTVSANSGFTLTGGNITANAAGTQSFVKTGSGNLEINSTGAGGDIFLRGGGNIQFAPMGSTVQWVMNSSGQIINNSTGRITGLPVPSVANEAATKSYVDGGSAYVARAWFTGIAAAAGTFTLYNSKNITSISWSGTTFTGTLTAGLTSTQCTVLCSGELESASGIPAIFSGTCNSTSTFTITPYSTLSVNTPMTISATAWTLKCAVFGS